MVGERVRLQHPRARGEAPQVGTHYAVFASVGPWGRGQLGDEDLVVYVHGFCASMNNLTAGVDGGMARHLVDQGYCVLAFDWFGHGLTDAPPGPIHARDVVAQLEALLEHLQVTRPVHLLGYSTGCLFASIFAARHPHRVKRLVFVSPFGYRLPGNVSGVACAFYTLLVKVICCRTSPRLRTTYRIIRSFDGAESWGPALARLREVRARVLVVCGSMDDNFWTAVAPHAQHIHASLPASRLHWLQEAGHADWIYGSSAVQLECRSVIADFLAEKPLFCTTCLPPSAYGA